MNLDVEGIRLTALSENLLEAKQQAIEEPAPIAEPQPLEETLSMITTESPSVQTPAITEPAAVDLPGPISKESPIDEAVPNGRADMPSTTVQSMITEPGAFVQPVIQSSSDNVHAQILQLKAEGKGIRAIARAVKLSSPSSVDYQLKRHEKGTCVCYQVPN